jgi:chromosome segregation ATPase
VCPDTNDSATNRCSLQDELRTVRDANSELDANRGQLAKHASSLELSASGLSQEVATLQHEVADISDKCRAALARAEEAEKAAAVSKDQVTALEADCQQLKKQVGDLQAQVSPLLAERTLCLCFTAWCA